MSQASKDKRADARDIGIVSYMERTRQYYRALGYEQDYVWARFDDVPFAPNCVRYELGIKTGRSGDHLRRSLNNGPQFKLIREVSTPEFTVDGDRVRAVFELATKPSLFGRRVGAKVDETFLIPADAAAS